MRLLRQADIETALPMPEAIRLMGQAFTAISQGSAQASERQVLTTSAGHALLMGASAENRGITAKLVTVLPGNRVAGLPVSSGLALLFDERNGTPLALLDATALTSWRTAAAAGLATRLLARTQCRAGVLIGCGTQARAQLLAMDATRNLEEIHLIARDQQKVKSFVEVMQPSIRARLVAAPDARQAVRSADIITAATTSVSPVINGQDVAVGCHVNGIGSFRPDMREFDQALIAKSRIFVESRSTAAAEAGELIAAIHSGVTRVDAWQEMGEVVQGKCPGRNDEQEVTFYKSVGHAVFDLFAASAIHQQCVKNGLGMEWDL